MKQYEAVIQALRRNGGYGTLGWLYQVAMKIPGVEWKTKTPFASIRRIVQDPRSGKRGENSVALATTKIRIE
jgi:hypothetical protein